MLQRITISALGVLIAGTGMVTMLRGRLEYSNLYHAPVFSPYAVVVGIFVALVAWLYKRRQR